jgi:hypothetical protein
MDTSDDTTSVLTTAVLLSSLSAGDRTRVHEWSVRQTQRRRHHRAYTRHRAHEWLNKQFHVTTPDYDTTTAVWPPATALSSSSPSPPPSDSPQAATELMALGQ